MFTKNRINVVFILICVLILSTLLVGACAAPAPTTAPTPTATTSAPPIPGMKPGEENLYFNWKFASPFGKHFSPEFFATHEWWPEQMKARTGGHMNIEVVYGGALAGAGETFQLLGANVFELGNESPSFYTNLILAAADTIPGLCQPYTDFSKFAKIKQFMFQHPLTKQEMKNTYNCVPVIGGGASPFVLLTDKKVEKLADMKGLRVRGSGVYATFFTNFGAVPVAFPTVESYEWFQRGMIDMVPFSIAEIPARKMQEVVPYATDLGWIAGGGGVFGNAEKWDALPQYIKDINTQLLTEYDEQFVKDFTPGYETARKFVWEESGIKIVTPAPDLAAAWSKAVDTILTDWVANAKKQGNNVAGYFVTDVKAFIAALDKNPKLEWSPDIYDHTKHPEIYTK